MTEIPSAEALSLFSKWKRQNKNLAVLGSNASCVVSARNARVSLRLDDLLQLTFGEDGIIRFFVRGALRRQMYEIFPKIQKRGTRNMGRVFKFDL